MAGAALGVISIPLTFWLYLQFFVDPTRALILGFPWLFLMEWHFSLFGGADRVSINIVNDLTAAMSINALLNAIAPISFWTLIYSLVGTILDYIRFRYYCSLRKNVS